VREVTGTEAVIYGDGPARPAVEQILCEQGDLPVHLAGFVENNEIPKRLRDCHAVVLLSERKASDFFAGGNGFRCGSYRPSRSGGRDRIGGGRCYGSAGRRPR
jgi:hypothetical protein